VFDRIVPAGLAQAAAQHLQTTGVQSGDVVAWLGHNSWDMLATLVACEQLGAVLLPLNWRLAAAELATITRHAGAAHLLGTPELEALAQQVLRLGGTLASQGQANAPSASPSPQETTQPGDLLLVYTSGTTGQPKGAMHTRAGLAANAVAAIAAQGLNTSTRTLAVLPLFHMGGLCIQTLPTLVAGGQVLLHPRFDADAWFDAVASWRPTTSLLVPAVMQALVAHPRWAQADVSALQFVCAGSQIVPLHLIAAFHARGVPVAQVYGATETGPVSIVLQPAQALQHAGHTGWPALGVQVRLVNASVPDEASGGELHIKAPNLMRGYYRSTSSGLDAQGWFATGDLARRHSSGAYEVLGRTQELIISGGENIHPAEIEQWVQQRPEVLTCAVVGLPETRWGEVPVLAVVLRPGATLDTAALQAVFDEHLARFKHPRRTHVLPALPQTALGKVRRFDLAQLLQAL
jgi:fatty-acyl-CoA synthase